MILFYLDYLLLFRKIRYYLGACASQVLFKLLKSKGAILAKNGQNGQKSWKKHAIQNEFRREGKTQSEIWFDFCIYHEILYYISCGFVTIINLSCLTMTSHYV